MELDQIALHTRLYLNSKYHIQKDCNQFMKGLLKAPNKLAFHIFN